MNNNEVSLIYVWDVYCGWCYGFSKSLHDFLDNHLSLPVEVISGGLFVGERSLPISSYPHIAGANNRIQELTGVKYGPAYEELLKEGSFVLDSTRAAIGFEALVSLAPDRAMQHAFYYDGLSLSDEMTFKAIASKAGIDLESVAEQMENQDIIRKALDNFERVRDLGISGYPSLLLRKGKRIVQLGGGAMTSDKIEASYKAALADELISFQ